MSTTVIRRREPDDLEACVDALAVVHGSDRYPDTWPTDPKGWLTLNAAWIALQNDSVVGHISLEAESATALKVSRLFVLPAARGDRVGERLLAAASDYAVEHGCGLVLDVIEESVAAIALYERLGWELAGSRPAEWIMQNGTRPVERRYIQPTSR